MIFARSVFAARLAGMRLAPIATIAVTTTTLTNGQSVTGSATLTMPNAAVNQDACQGVSPQLTITAT